MPERSRGATPDGRRLVVVDGAMLPMDDGAGSSAPDTRPAARSSEPGTSTGDEERMTAHAALTQGTDESNAVGDFSGSATTPKRRPDGRRG